MIRAVPNSDGLPLARRLRQALSRSLLSGLEIYPGEGPSALAAGWMFFLLLTSLMILRPVRDALGIAQGVENIRRLFLVTVAFTLLITPLFGWMASRIPRRLLIAAVFRGCALLLLAFFAGITMTPESVRAMAGSGYYIFHSVFNLLVVSLFWAFMADHFNLAESKRLFPPIALGGSLGAILGSTVSWHLTRHFGIGPLFILAALLLELAVRTSIRFAGIRSLATHLSLNGASMGGSWLAGVKAVLQSSYVRQIGGFVVLNGMITTFLYFTGLRLVAAAGGSAEHQTLLFARLNFWTQMATLLAQAFLAGRIMRATGVGTALAALPALGICGAAALALAPTLLVFTMVNAAFRAVQQGIAGPAQETLFTVLSRQEKYKAKAFLDTFGYRTGDAAGAHIEGVVSGVGMGLLPFAGSILGLGALWLAFGLVLGRSQDRLACSASLSAVRLPEASAAGPAASILDPYHLNLMNLDPIGLIRSPFRQAAGTPVQNCMAKGVEGFIELLPELAPGLRELEGFDRIWLLYWFDRAVAARLLVTPYLDQREHGIFATRSPARPNPIGLSCVRLLGIDGHWLRVGELDILDQTPLLDIKPYVPAFDSFQVERIGWLTNKMLDRVQADDRFEKHVPAPSEMVPEIGNKRTKGNP